MVNALNLFYSAISVLSGALAGYVVWRGRGSRLSAALVAFMAPLIVWSTALAFVIGSADAHALGWIRAATVAIAAIPAAIFFYAATAARRLEDYRRELRVLFAASLVSAAVFAFTDILNAEPWLYPWGYYPRFSWVCYLTFFPLVIYSLARSFRILALAVREAPPGWLRDRLRWILAGMFAAYLAAGDLAPALGVPIPPVFAAAAMLSAIAIYGWGIARFKLFDMTPSFAARTILATMQDGVAVCDAEGYIRVANDALAAMSGCSRAGLAGKAISGLLTAPDGEPVTPALLRDWRPRDTQAWWLAANGRKIPLSLTVSPIKEGGSAGFVLVGHDMSARQALEAELLKLRRAVEQVDSLILITDLQGSIEYANSRISEKTGYAREEIIGRNPRIFKSGETDGGIYRGMWDALLAGKEWRGEFHNRKKNGELFWTDSVISPVRDAAGRITHFVSVQQDITERKEHERLLREAYDNLRATQLQLIEAAKFESVGRLSAGVAHEVKNPLAVILMGVEYLDRNLQGCPEEMREVLGDVREAIFRADRVIQDLLEFARPKQVRLAAWDLNAALGDALRIMRFELEKAHVEVRQEVQEGLPQLVFDGQKMQQVLVNLILNAVHAMEPDGGVLSLRARACAAGGLPASFPEALRGASGEWIVISVEDTGPGIPEEILPRLFDPFFTTKQPGRGTGLGLSICRTIVEMHQGALSLENSPGGPGARAVIALPVLPHEPPAGNAGDGAGAQVPPEAA